MAVEQASIGAVAGARAGPPAASGHWGQAWRRLRRDRAALAGGVVIIALILCAVFAPWIAPYDYTAQNMANRYAPPGGANLLGTDALGRDVLSRLFYGARISLAVGVIAVGIAVSFGVMVGAVAGYVGGKVDLLLMWVMDLILAFPIYLLAIILMVIFTPTAGLIGTIKVTGAIAIVRIPIYARLVRGSVLSIKEKEYVEACRALGVRDPWILLRHVLPNCLAPIIVTTTLGIATSIIVEATLSFLGLGTQPPTPSWGWDLKANVAFIQANMWLSLFPGLAIFVTVLGFNLFGDGLRDALDPRLK